MAQKTHAKKVKTKRPVAHKTKPRENMREVPMLEYNDDVDSDYDDVLRDAEELAAEMADDDEEPF